MNEVVYWAYDDTFCAAAFKNESIHSDNFLVHELDPLQIGWKDGNEVNALCSLGKP